MLVNAHRLMLKSLTLTPVGVKLKYLVKLYRTIFLSSTPSILMQILTTGRMHCTAAWPHMDTANRGICPNNDNCGSYALPSAGPKVSVHRVLHHLESPLSPVHCSRKQSTAKFTGKGVLHKKITSTLFIKLRFLLTLQ